MLNTLKNYVYQEFLITEKSLMAAMLNKNPAQKNIVWFHLYKNSYTNAARKYIEMLTTITLLEFKWFFFFLTTFSFFPNISQRVYITCILKNIKIIYYIPTIHTNHLISLKKIKTEMDKTEIRQRHRLMESLPVPF